MENNSAEICDNSSSLMGDVSFIAGVDCSAMLAHFLMEDSVIADRLWFDGNGQQEYPHEVIDIHETSIFSQDHGLIENNLHLQYGTPEMKSAFRNYKKEVQLCFAPTMKQKSIKRCFRFLRRIHKNSRERLYCEANNGFVEESYASTHRIAERNRRIKLNQQFLALHSLLPHNTKKPDKMSTLTNAIKELNRRKRRIEELEQLNKSLSNAVGGNSISEGCGSLSYERGEDSRRNELKDYICEEVDVRAFQMIIEVNE